MSTEKQEAILFEDIETNGLQVGFHQILEIACVLTTTDLQELGRFHRVVLPFPALGALDKEHIVQPAYDDADDFVREMHTASGLWEDLRGKESVLLEEANADLRAWLGSMIQVHNLDKPLVGGASIHFDRKFTERQMPEVMDLCHHRCFDVSTLKRQFEWWFGIPVPELPREGDSHRAMSDILYTIEEAKWMRRTVRKFQKSFKGSLLSDD